MAEKTFVPSVQSALATATNSKGIQFMGTDANITSSNFPKQGAMLNKRVECFFHYDASKIVEGVVMRDDIEEPFRRIIHLDDGRLVLGGECQLSPID